MWAHATCGSGVRPSASRARERPPPAWRAHRTCMPSSTMLKPCEYASVAPCFMWGITAFTTAVCCLSGVRLSTMSAVGISCSHTPHATRSTRAPQKASAVGDGFECAACAAHARLHARPHARRRRSMGLGPVATRTPHRRCMQWPCVRADDTPSAGTCWVSCRAAPIPFQHSVACPCPALRAGAHSCDGVARGGG